MSQPVIIHTDGACSGNPGPGGWGAVLRYRGAQRDISGGADHTTNNRMELMAAIEALAHLKWRCAVEIHTDSTYVRNGITKWVVGWQANGWMTKARTPVKNADLWRRLVEVCAEHEVQWFWVKGHAGDRYNEAADALARAAIPAGRG